MNKQYFDKRRQRINQKLEVLFERRDFRNDVKILRDKWHLPQEGIKDEGKNQEWHYWLDAETDRYVEENWAKSKEKMRQLIEQGKLIKREEENKRFNASVPINALYHDVWNLLHKYRLPASWHNSIKRYLLFNDQNNLWIPLGNITMQITWDEKTNHRQLSLILNADTTLVDVKSIWKMVKLEQKRLQDKTAEKFQPIDNLKRDTRILELENEGKSYEEIAEVIRQEYGLPDFGYENVSKILPRIKKRFGQK